MTKKTYLNRITGVVGEYEERTAGRFGYLIEVRPETATCAPCAAKVLESESDESPKGADYEEIDDEDDADLAR